MAWIPIHQSLTFHRKTIAVAEALGLPEVYIVGHLTAFWLWALDNAPNGNMPKSARAVAVGAQFAGDAKVFLAVLIEAGFLEDHGDYISIHQWNTYGGKLLEKRTANAERIKRTRTKYVLRTDDECTAQEKSRVDKSTTFAPSAPSEASPELPATAPTVKTGPAKQPKLPSISKTNPVYEAVMEVCEVDLALASVEQITNATKCAKRFLAAGEAHGKSPPEIAGELRECRRRFDKMAWEGKSGDPPTPRQLQDKFKSLMNRSQSPNGQHGTVTPPPTTADPSGGYNI